LVTASWSRIYLLGLAALLERLPASIMRLPFVRLLRRGCGARHVRWQDMDLGEPEHARPRTGAARRKQR
jgi:hypothetical protein